MNKFQINKILSLSRYATIVAVVISIILVLIEGKWYDYYSMNRVNTKIKTSDKDKFFIAIDKKFELQLINGKEDIVIILNSISRESNKIYSIAPILEDYITNHLNYQNEKNQAQKEEIARRYNLLKNIISEENKEKPFQAVPNEERRLLVALKDGIQDKDLQSLEFNLNELYTVISTRNNIYEKTANMNRWSVPLALIGVISTIVFGIMTLKSKNKKTPQRNM
jgi:hypothetical protein